MLYGNVTNPWCQANAEFYCPWKFSKVQPNAMECFIIVYLCKKFKTKTILQNEEINFVWYNLLKFVFFGDMGFFFVRNSRLSNFKTEMHCEETMIKTFHGYIQKVETLLKTWKKNEVKMLFSFLFWAKNGKSIEKKPKKGLLILQHSLNLTQRRWVL